MGEQTTVLFQDPQTAAQYDCAMPIDQVVHVPGQNYRDKISKIPPRIAEILIQQGFTWVSKKPQPVISPAASETE